MWQLRAILLSILIVSIFAHCQVPCGIYDDDLRVRQMFEDLTTIDKAIDEIQSLWKKMENAGDDNKLFYTHQITRWINTKEHHADNIIETISTYFLLQRIPEDNVNEILNAIRIMKLALKAKQSLEKTFSIQLKQTLDIFAVKYLPPSPEVLTLSSLQTHLEIY